MIDQIGGGGAAGAPKEAILYSARLTEGLI